MKSLNKIFRDVAKYVFGSKEFSFLPRCDRFLYPLNLDFTIEDEDFYYSPMDENGIPYKVYSSVGKQYNPTRIAAYALANYNAYAQGGGESSLKNFFRAADWFYETEEAEYKYRFDWKDLKAPWISCMAQGEASSVLLRAYKITGDDKYLLHAGKTLAPFFKPVSQGGVQSKLADGSLFLEEYPSPKPDHVLNGFLYGVIGLSEYCEYHKGGEHGQLLDQLLESLKKNLHQWSLGQWSLYQLPNAEQKLRNFCTPSYHHLQISQLRWLNEQHPAKEITNVIGIWEKGLNSFPVRMRAMTGKVLYRLKNRAQR